MNVTITGNLLFVICIFVCWLVSGTNNTRLKANIPGNLTHGIKFDLLSQENKTIIVYLILRRVNN